MQLEHSITSPDELHCDFSIILGLNFPIQDTKCHQKCLTLILVTLHDLIKNQKEAFWDDFLLSTFRFDSFNVLRVKFPEDQKKPGLNFSTIHFSSLGMLSTNCSQKVAC